MPASIAAGLNIVPNVPYTPRRRAAVPLAAALICCLPLLSACGQKGDLYLPDAPAEQAGEQSSGPNPDGTR